MFCSKCGTNMADDAAFCPACGASTAPQQAAPAYQQPTYQQPTYQQPTYQQPTYPQQGYQQPAYQQPEQPQTYAYPAPNPPVDRFGGTPMKWYKFLIYFSLFAGALLNVVNGINYLTGALYEGSAEYVYTLFEGLQALDIVMGLGCIALAAFGIYVRMRLAGLYQNGPQMLNYLYIGVIALNLIYSVGAAAIIGDFGAESIGTIVGNIIGNVVILAINTNYFGKRKHLFVN